MQADGNLSPNCWDFIQEEEEIGGPHATAEEQAYCFEVAAGYLRATFPLPEGYVLEVVHVPFYTGQYIAIALGWNEPEPLSINERWDFIRRMVEPLSRFCRAVDWEELRRIRTHIKDVPGLEALKSLLRQHEDLSVVRRCLEYMTLKSAAIRLEKSPKPAAGLYKTHSGRVRETPPHHVVEESKPFVPALKRMADVDERISVHTVCTHLEDFFIITDAYIHHLVYIKGESPSCGLYLRPADNTEQPDS